MTDLKTPQSIKLELSDCCKTAFRFCKIVSLKTLKTICNWKTIAIQCPDNHFNSIFWRFWFVLLKVSIWFSNNCIITQDWLKFQQNWPSPIESIKDFNFQYENYWKSNGFQCKMTMTLSIRQRQGNLFLRGIVNWLGAARSVHLTVFSNIFLYFNLKQKQFLRTMLAYGFHSEYFFWKKSYIKNLQFWTILLCAKLKREPIEILYLLTFSLTIPL